MSTGIIDSYNGALEGFRSSVRTYAPYTFIAYRSLIPSPDDDMVEYANKICDVAALHFLVNLIATVVHPVLLLLPYIPLVLDLGRVLYHVIGSVPFEPASDEVRTHSPWRRAGAILLLVVGIFGLRATAPGQLLSLDR